MSRTTSFFARRASAILGWTLASILAAPSRMNGVAPSLTLEEALNLARERAPDVAAARIGVETARAQRRTAAELPNPVLTATTNKIPTDGSSAATFLGNGLLDRSYDSTVGLSQLVEVGGKRRRRRVSADEGITQAEARLADAERLLTPSVVRAYVAAVLARSAVEIGRQTEESFRKTARLAADREEAGDISASERAQVEIAAGRFAAEADAAEATFRNAVRSLEALIGLSPEAGRDLSDGIESVLAATPDLAAADDEDALARRPDVLSLVSAVRRAEADLDLQRAIRFPDPTVLAQYERQPPDQRNTVGIGIALPLPVFSRNAGGIAVAESALLGARRDLDIGRLRARGDLAGSRDALEAARARLARFRDELLPKAERVRSTVEYSYNQGGASLLELLEAERNANDIRLAALSAAADLITSRTDFASARTMLAATGGFRP